MEQTNYLYKLLQFSTVSATSLLISLVSKYFLTGQPLLIIVIAMFALITLWWIIRAYWLWVSPYKKHVSFCLLGAGAINILGFILWDNRERGTGNRQQIKARNNWIKQCLKMHFAEILCYSFKSLSILGLFLITCYFFALIIRYIAK